jgi:pimeloyl-ACP methyl ester carboxylesterase
MSCTGSALLIHGLGRTPVSMFPLAGPIRRAGLRTHFFGYSTTLESMTRIVSRLRRKLEEHRPEFLVAHSLGGILLRRVLAEWPQPFVRHFVMLGTPNQSPRLARYFWRWWLFRRFAGSCGNFLATPAEYDRLPPPNVPCTVIAGTSGPTGRFSPFGNEPNDGIVSVSETRIEPRWDPIRVPAAHTLMMRHREVHRHLATVLTSFSPLG